MPEAHAACCCVLHRRLAVCNLQVSKVEYQMPLCFELSRSLRSFLPVWYFSCQGLEPLDAQFARLTGTQ